jgi:predicted transcriptional regulator
MSSFSMRILVDLPDTHIHTLAALCERVNRSRAALIREAIAEYLHHHAATTAEATFGLWGAEAMDGLAYQEKVRDEW